MTFQYEPIAAASTSRHGRSGEQIVLVADIGGGTSKQVVRVDRAGAPPRAQRTTSWPTPRRASRAPTSTAASPGSTACSAEFGYRSLGPAQNGAPPRKVPSAVCFDLATWHLSALSSRPARRRTAPRTAFTLPTRASTGGDDGARAAPPGTISRPRRGAAKLRRRRRGLGDRPPGLVRRGLAVALRAGGGALDAIAVDLALHRRRGAPRRRRCRLQPGDIAMIYFTRRIDRPAPARRADPATVPAARAVAGDRFAKRSHGAREHAARCYGSARRQQWPARP